MQQQIPRCARDDKFGRLMPRSIPARRTVHCNFASGLIVRCVESSVSDMPTLTPQPNA